MLDPKKYGTPDAFRAALEQKIRSECQSKGLIVDDLKRQISFDRFLARLDFDRYTLVGGYSLELRFAGLKRTRDIDLALTDLLIASASRQDLPDRIEADLKKYASIHLNDYFSFVIDSARSLSGPPEGGYRYHFSAMLAGREYHKFHVDLRIQSVHILPPEMVKAPNKLDFPDVRNNRIALARKEEVFADKLEAYTKPRQTTNSRVRDLIDMNLLLLDKLNNNTCKQAINTIFKQHKRSVPDKLEPPPELWREQFTIIAQNGKLDFTMDDAFHNIESFINKLRRIV